VVFLQQLAHGRFVEIGVLCDEYVGARHNRGLDEHVVIMRSIVSAGTATGESIHNDPSPSFTTIMRVGSIANMKRTSGPSAIQMSSPKGCKKPAVISTIT